VVNTLNSYCNGAVGFIGWLDEEASAHPKDASELQCLFKKL
jgi:hypothetical protein